MSAKDKGKTDAMKETPPPAMPPHDEPDGDEGKGEGDDDGDEDQAFKALQARLAGLGAAPAVTPPAAPPPPPPVDNNEEVIVDGNELLKAIRSDIASATGVIGKNVGELGAVQTETLQMLKSLSSTVKAQAAKIAELEKRPVSSPKRVGYLSILEPPSAQMAKSEITREQYEVEGRAFIGKSVMAAEKGLVPVTVPGMVEACVNRGLNLHEYIPARTLSIIKQVAA